MAKLTPKQQRFCDEYLIDLNATQAAIRAGYSERTAKEIGSENLTKPNIKNYIEERMAEKESELIADQAEVLKYLSTVIRGESRAAVLARQFDGSEDVIYKGPDEKERLRAAELMGKRYGLFSEKLDVSGAIPVVISGADDLED